MFRSLATASAAALFTACAATGPDPIDAGAFLAATPIE